MDCGVHSIDRQYRKMNKFGRQIFSSALNILSLSCLRASKLGHLSGAVKGAVIGICLGCMGEEMKRGTPYVKPYEIIKAVPIGLI